MLASSDDRVAERNVALRAVALDRGFKVVAQPVQLQLRTPVRKHEGIVTILGTEKGTYRLVVAAKSPINSPYWPMSVTVK